MDVEETIRSYVTESLPGGLGQCFRWLDATDLDGDTIQIAGTDQRVAVDSDGFDLYIDDDDALDDVYDRLSTRTDELTERYQSRAIAALDSAVGPNERSLENAVYDVEPGDLHVVCSGADGSVLPIQKPCSVVISSCVHPDDRVYVVDADRAGFIVEQQPVTVSMYYDEFRGVDVYRVRLKREYVVTDPDAVALSSTSQ